MINIKDTTIASRLSRAYRRAHARCAKGKHDERPETAPPVGSSDGLGRELRYISDTPELLGLLYELDLLPEQITFGTRDQVRMLQLTAWYRHTRSQRPNDPKLNVRNEA